MSNNWNDWEQKAKTAFEPLPPGQYVAVIDNASVEYNEKGARTKITLKVVEGQHTNRLIWENYPHNDKFRWFARMAWESLGFQHVPEGDSMEQMFLSISRALTDSVGKAVRVTTDQRTKTWQGKDYVNVIVRRLEAMAPAQQQQQPQQLPGGYDAPW